MRAERLSNTSIIQLSNDEFLLAGESGVRKHSMGECLESSSNPESNSQDFFIFRSVTLERCTIILKSGAPDRKNHDIVQ